MRGAELNKINDHAKMQNSGIRARAGEAPHHGGMARHGSNGSAEGQPQGNPPIWDTPEAIACGASLTHAYGHKGPTHLFILFYLFRHGSMPWQQIRWRAPTGPLGPPHEKRKRRQPAPPPGQSLPPNAGSPAPFRAEEQPAHTARGGAGEEGNASIRSSPSCVAISTFKRMQALPIIHETGRCGSGSGSGRRRSSSAPPV